MSDGATFVSGNQTGLAANTVVATEDYDLGGTPMKHQRVKLAIGPVDSGDYDLTGNEEITLFASAARASGSAQNSSDQVTPSAKGVLILIDVTASTNAKTLAAKIQAKDPVSAAYVTIYDFSTVVTADGSNLTKAILLYPQADDTDFADVKALKGNLPRTWRLVMTASDATSWTYSVGGCLLY